MHGQAGRAVATACAVVAVLAIAGVAFAHDGRDGQQHGEQSSLASAEELGETVEREWAVTGTDGTDYTLQEVTIPDVWTRVGYNLVAEDGERLYGVWNAPACVGAEPGSFKIYAAGDAFELVGSTQDGASQVRLRFGDGSALDVDTFGASDVPMPFFHVTVAELPLSLVPLGVPTAGPCPDNQPQGGEGP